MRRVTIIGCGGSGKSHLARELGQRLSAPVTHLDEIYFDRDWNITAPQAFANAQQALVAQECWVIDGNYNATLGIRLRACDTVVLMDVPTPVALWGALSRQIRHGAGQHGDGVHNRLNWAVLRYIVTHRARMRPRVLTKINDLAQHADVVVLRCRRQTRRWLQHIESGQPGR